MLAKTPLRRGFLFLALAVALLGAYVVFGANGGWGMPLSSYDQQRVGQLLLLVFAAIAFVVSSLGVVVAQVLWRLPVGVAGSLLVVAMVGLISAIWAPMPEWALLEWSTFILSFLLMLVVAALRVELGGRFDLLLGGAFVISIAAYIVSVAAAYSTTLLASFPLLASELFHGFINVRFFGQFQTLTLPLLVIPLMAGSWPKGRYFWIGLIVLWWMLAMASGTRGTWLGMGAAAIGIAWLAWKERLSFSWLKWEAWGAAGGLSLYFLFFYLLPSLLTTRAEVVSRLSALSSLSGREILWGHAWDLIREHPWLGVGPMHFAFYPNTVGAHPHNAALQIACEWGLPVLLAGGIALCWGLWKLAPRQMEVDEGVDCSLAAPLKIGLYAAVIASLTQSLVDGVLAVPFSQTVLTILLGWAIGLRLARQPEELPPTWLRRGLMVFFMLVATVLVATAMSSALRLESRQSDYLAHHQTPVAPRYWLQGWID